VSAISSPTSPAVACVVDFEAIHYNLYVLRAFSSPHFNHRDLTLSTFSLLSPGCHFRVHSTSLSTDCPSSTPTAAPSVTPNLTFSQLIVRDLLLLRMLCHQLPSPIISMSSCLLSAPPSTWPWSGPLQCGPICCLFTSVASTSKSFNNTLASFCCRSLLWYRSSYLLGTSYFSSSLAFPAPYRPSYFLWQVSVQLLPHRCPLFHSLTQLQSHYCCDLLGNESVAILINAWSRVSWMLLSDQLFSSAYNQQGNSVTKAMLDRADQRIRSLVWCSF